MLPSQIGTATTAPRAWHDDDSHSNISLFAHVSFVRVKRAPAVEMKQSFTEGVHGKTLHPRGNSAHHNHPATSDRLLPVTLPEAA